MKLEIPNSWNDYNQHFLTTMENPWYKFLVKLQNFITVETMKFYEKKGIITMHLPVTTGSISSPMGRGSDSLPVRINLEGINTYLADSMQFLLEYGCRLNSNGVYYVMPSFRGEKADERHLCQFYHSEVEIPGKLENVMNLVDEYIKYLSRELIKQFGKELEEKIGDISHIKKIANKEDNFTKITFDEAEKILKKLHLDSIGEYIEYNEGWRNITRKGELELLRYFDGLVWVTNYDSLAVPFYQAMDKDGKTCRNADLLMGIGETVGCGERHMNYNDLISALNNHEVNVDDYSWYIEMKKRYPIQTSGFGMGVERFLMWVLKCDDIRNLQLLLRFNGIDTTPKFNIDYINHQGTIPLETEKLKLRRITMDDVEPMFNNWANDDDVTRYLTWKSHGNIEVTKHVVKSWIDSYGQKDFYQWVIEDKKTGYLIGTISVVNKNDDEKEFELGICLSKKYWGQKIALEATNCVMKFLKSIGYKKMVVTTKVGNEKSIRTLNKRDYEYQGITKDGCTNFDGTKDDIHVYKKVL